MAREINIILRLHNNTERGIAAVARMIKAVLAWCGLRPTNPPQN